MYGLLIELIHLPGKSVGFNSPGGRDDSNTCEINFRNTANPPGPKLQPLTYDDVKGVIDKINESIPNYETLLVLMVQRQRQLAARSKASADRWVGEMMQPYADRVATYLDSIGKSLSATEKEGLLGALVEERKTQAARGVRE